VSEVGGKGEGVAKGKKLQGKFWGVWHVSIILVVMVSFIYILIKTKQKIYFKDMRFTVY
jgi:hypothetical protein